MTKEKESSQNWVTIGQPGYLGKNKDEQYAVWDKEYGVDISTWPAGWLWSPGLIPAVHPELIPVSTATSWWQAGSIEDLYQSAKILQITL